MPILALFDVEYYSKKSLEETPKTITKHPNYLKQSRTDSTDIRTSNRLTAKFSCRYYIFT